MDDSASGRMTQNISLSDHEHRALTYLARRKYANPDGTLRRGAYSWVVVDLLHEKMRAEIGRDWAEALSETEAVPA